MKRICPLCLAALLLSAAFLVSCGVKQPEIPFKGFVQTVAYDRETARAIDGSTGKETIIDLTHPLLSDIDFFAEHFKALTLGPIDREIPKYCYRIKILEIESYTEYPSILSWDGQPMTIYHVMVLYDETHHEKVNKDAYLLDRYSCPAYQVYGYPRYHIGGEYLIADAYLPYLTEWRQFPEDYCYPPFYCFEIEEIDGVEYLYPIRTDISSLDFKIEITDPAENRMYKDDKDADIVRYLAEKGMENPVFGYKMRLDDFVRYRSDYTAEWNARITENGPPPLDTDPKKFGDMSHFGERTIVNPRKY
ncbi:MAG: hypothetical protein IKQ92_14875 [Clostridia bacterium]|nr:hypothetical protein [Clostridia bacterium]